MRPSALQPIGDTLVSYSAEQMPTAAIETLHRDVIDEHRVGERSSDSTVQILDLLVRISLQKLKALA